MAQIGKAAQATRAVAADPSLLHLALHASRGESTELAKLLGARLGEDDLATLVSELARVGGIRRPELRNRLAAEWLQSHDVVVSFTHDGTRWSIPGGDIVLPEMIATGRYEGGDIDAVLAWVAGDPQLAGRRLALDVGANVGTSTVPFAQAGFDVVAVEPVPATFALLARNVADNDLDQRVTCVARAVSGAGGTVTLAVGDGLALSEVVADADTTAVAAGFEVRETVEIRATPLADLLEELDRSPADVAFVWSDTQGSETEVIRTGAPIWAGGAPLFAEVWPEALDLHGGVAAFAAAAAEHFASFIDAPDLRTNGRSATRWPVRTLHAFVDDLSAATDLLLVPPDATGGS